MNINLTKLNYKFNKKPLLVGGKAMEYYGLRNAGEDIDLVVVEEDLIGLIMLYPNRVKDLWGDLGVCPYEFEIWKTICFFDYDFYREDSIEKENYLIISLEKLIFMKALAYKKDKYFEDFKMIVKDILDRQGGKYEEINLANKKLLAGLGRNISYIEKAGPTE